MTTFYNVVKPFRGLVSGERIIEEGKNYYKEVLKEQGRLTEFEINKEVEMSIKTVRIAKIYLKDKGWVFSDAKTKYNYKSLDELNYESLDNWKV